MHNIGFPPATYRARKLNMISSLQMTKEVNAIFILFRITADVSITLATLQRLRRLGRVSRFLNLLKKNVWSVRTHWYSSKLTEIVANDNIVLMLIRFKLKT